MIPPSSPVAAERSAILLRAGIMKTISMAIAVLGLVFVVQGVPARAEHPPNTVSLFDGRSFDGWVMLDGSPVNDGWEIVDGAIHLKAGRKRAGSIRTVDSFGSFELEFQWKVAAGGNSGVKYRVRASKVATVPGFGEQEGFILLQEHLSKAWFRNLRLTRLEVPSDTSASPSPR
jgi:hypothetical protein